MACVSAVHAAVVTAAEAGEEEGELLGFGLRVASVWCEGLADGLAEPDGLALAWVKVIVVTLFDDDTVAVTSAPVVPIRRMPARAPAFAWKKNSRIRSNMLC
jgi:hypothetical protein